MKRVILLGLLMLCAFNSFAKNSKALPKGTYKWNDFEKAKDEAIKQKKPLLIFYIDPKTR